MANNIRIKRLNHAFMEEISMILMEEVRDEDLKFVTITGCDITNDLSYAKVYFTTLHEENKETLENALNKASGFIRSELCKRVTHLRKMPELTFTYDTSVSYGMKIENIIEKINEDDK